MSASFSVIFEVDVPPHGKLGDDTSLAKHKEELDRMAVDNGLTSLDAFESYDPDDLGGFFDEDEVAEIPPIEWTVQWFKAADGLDAVRALVAHLNDHPDAVLDHEKILADLATIESDLSRSERDGVRFRFAIVP